MKNLINYIIIFIIGALGYSLLEILWRGYTHISMTVTGGVCLLILFFINKLGISVWQKALIGSGVITLIELAEGMILNVYLKLGIWDYSSVPFNFKGQICLLYSFIWFVLCLALFELPKLYISFISR